jgi:hypothetical protein
VGGQPGITEHDQHGRRRPNSEMTYPPRDGRNHYRVGDVILIGEYEQRWLEQLCPDLRRDRQQSAPSLLQLALGFLGEEPPKYTLAFRIAEIIPHGTYGEGDVRLIPELYFRGEPNAQNQREVEMVELEPQWRTQAGLILAFVTDRQLMTELIVLGRWVMEAALMVASAGASGARQAGRRIARRLILRVAMRAARRRILVRILRFIKRRAVRAAASASQSFIEAFVEEISNTQQENALRRAADARELDEDDLRPALMAGLTAFAQTLVTEAFGEWLRESIRDSAQATFEEDQIIGNEGRAELVTFITNQIAQTFTTRVANALLQAVGNALRRSARGDGEFGDLVGPEIRRQVPNLDQILAGAITEIRDEALEVDD